MKSCSVRPNKIFEIVITYGAPLLAGHHNILGSARRFPVSIGKIGANTHVFPRLELGKLSLEFGTSVSQGITSQQQAEGRIATPDDIDQGTRTPCWIALLGAVGRIVFLAPWTGGWRVVLDICLCLL